MTPSDPRDDPGRDVRGKPQAGHGSKTKSPARDLFRWEVPLCAGVGVVWVVAVVLSFEAWSIIAIFGWGLLETRYAVLPFAAPATATVAAFIAFRCCGNRDWDEPPSRRSE